MPRPLTPDPNRFQPTRIRCAIHGCPDSPAVDTFVCLPHAITITGDLNRILKQYRDAHPVEDIDKPEYQGYVYYLMVGPQTVKIGTTRNLTDRVNQLRSDLQYVVALELGTYDTERQRHLEYADERIGKREEFRLSDRLKAHIETLIPQRETLIADATARRTRSIAS